LSLKTLESKLVTVLDALKEAAPQCEAHVRDGMTALLYEPYYNEEVLRGFVVMSLSEWGGLVLET
jgi:hypothetical protein